MIRQLLSLPVLLVFCLAALAEDVGRSLRKRCDRILRHLASVPLPHSESPKAEKVLVGSLSHAPSASISDDSEKTP